MFLEDCWWCEQDSYSRECQTIRRSDRKPQSQCQYWSSENLDRVVLQSPARGETCLDKFWRQSFNLMARMDMLSKIRRTGIYHNTTEAVLKYVLHNWIFIPEIIMCRTDHYSRILFPTAFLLLNCVYWCLVLIWWMGGQHWSQEFISKILRY